MNHWKQSSSTTSSSYLQTCYIYIQARTLQMSNPCFLSYRIYRRMDMEASEVQDIVIVGAGIAGLTTSLGLHRLGIRSLVLESSGSLRITGFALTTWDNAWKALDAVGIGEQLRQEHQVINGNVSTSLITGQQTSNINFNAGGMFGGQEIRCVKRKSMLEALARELPNGTIRFASKVVSILDDGLLKVVHLADGTIIRTKVLIGCDGVNSLVAKWLGLKKAAFTGRYATRGIAKYSNHHGFESKFMQFFGEGVRTGGIPCDDNTVYWFFTWSPSKNQVKELEDNPKNLKEFVLSKLGNAPKEFRDVIQRSDPDSFMASPLRYRYPWELLWANISKGNVCIAGDAFHPMTPDVGQGGCSALEDGITLARCLGEAFSNIKKDERDLSFSEYKRIEMALKKYVDERKWRSMSLISSAYMVGFFQQSDNRLITFIRDKFLSAYLASLLVKRANFDCGKLKTC